MKIFKLAQQVELGICRKEWVDITAGEYEPNIREYAAKVKRKNPNAVLSLRMVEETELPLEEQNPLNESNGLNESDTVEWVINWMADSKAGGLIRIADSAVIKRIAKQCNGDLRKYCLSKQSPQQSSQRQDQPQGQLDQP